MEDFDYEQFNKNLLEEGQKEPSSDNSVIQSDNVNIVIEPDFENDTIDNSNTTPIRDEEADPFITIEDTSESSDFDPTDDEINSVNTQTKMVFGGEYDEIIEGLSTRDINLLNKNIDRLEAGKLTKEEIEKFANLQDKVLANLEFDEMRTSYAFKGNEAMGIKTEPSILQTGEVDILLGEKRLDPKQFVIDYNKRYIEKIESAKQNLQYELNKTGVYANEARKASIKALMQQAQDNPALDLNTIDWIVFGGEFVPFYGAGLALRDIPENVKEARKAWQEGRTKESVLLAGATTFEVVASLFSAKVVAKGLKGKIGTKSQTTVDKLNSIRSADKAELEKRIKAADEAAKLNPEIAERLIKEFEESIGGNSVSKMVDGKLVLDFDAAKKQGLLIAKQVHNLQDDRLKEFVDAIKVQDKKRIAELERKHGIGSEQVFAILEENAEGLMNPLLKADKFNSIVAIASDLQKKNPKAFSKDKTIIENLFNLAVKQDITENNELAEVLSKYNINFDEFVLTVVGSGSEAGKTLQKLGQLRSGGAIKIDNRKNKALENSQNAMFSFWRRAENIRRGGMVSMIKTAARNFQSGTIRMSLETLENISDTTILAMSDEFNNFKNSGKLRASLKAMGTGAKTVVSPENWKGSMGALKRIYATPGLSRELTEYLLDRPEYIDQYTALFDNVNEVRRNTGAGKGMIGDKQLSAIEDVVSVLNTPNRIQEFVIRRGVFIGELERLVKRDYGIDLMESLESGNMSDLMNNVSSLVPEGAPKFEELIESATKRALDVTYAKAPDIKMFNETSNFLTRTGLTAVTTPFPRFMFNSIELMGQYSAGAFNPAIKHALGMKKGPLDAKDRQNISRNLSGLVAITAAYQYRISDGAPSDYKLVEGGEDAVVDTTAQYPMRQFLWIAEAMRRLDPAAVDFIPQAKILKEVGAIGEGDSTFEQWFDPREAADVFLGQSGRTANASVFVREIADILGGYGTEDMVKGEASKKAIGRALGNYLRTYLIPVTQVVEIQRMVGVRPSEYKDAATDETATVSGEIMRTLRQSGVTTLFDPSSEFDMPNREFVLTQENKKRIRQPLGFALGITSLQKGDPDSEFLIKYGFDEKDLSSRKKGSVRRTENQLMSEYIPMIAENGRIAADVASVNYSNQSKIYRENNTKEEHIFAAVRAAIDTQVKTTRTNLIGDEKYRNTPEHVKMWAEFTRFSPAIRAQAQRMYWGDNGELPDPTDIDDIESLKFYAQDYRDRYSIKKPKR